MSDYIQDIIYNRFDQIKILKKKKEKKWLAPYTQFATSKHDTKQIPQNLNKLQG